MRQKKITLISLASALAAIAPTAQASVATERAAPKATTETGQNTQLGRPNTFYSLGEDLMGLVTSTADDGTLIAQHYSHSSHASHASHASHYSGR